MAFASRYKLRLAEQLAETFRAPLIAGDNRQIILDMRRPVLKDFFGVNWMQKSGGDSFSLPENFRGHETPLCGISLVKIYFDEQRTIEAGRLKFFYHRWELFPIAVLSWILLVLLSIITGRYEWARLEREYRASVESKINELRGDMAAQVAHDIRSPLAALGAAAKSLEGAEEQRKLIEGAVGRMQGIANDLLERYRAPSATPTYDKTSLYALAGLIEQVIAEKQLQHKERAGVKIEFSNPAGEVKAPVEPKELQRLLSNLINNAVEAFDKDGVVSVGLSVLDAKVLIEVKDNGKGIQAVILAKLGQKGETHGKAGGNGLGIYHARTTVEGWGGIFKIESEPGKGTTVTIELPRASAPNTLSRTAVLLDDDMLVHMNWKMAAKAASVELKAYKTPEDFTANIVNLPKDTPIYIDSDLGNDIKGEDIAKELYNNNFTNITMATGHGPEKFAHLPWLC